MLTDCYSLGGGNGAQDREQKKKILPALNREYTLVNLECPDDEQ